MNPLKLIIFENCIIFLNKNINVIKFLLDKILSRLIKDIHGTFNCINTFMLDNNIYI